MAAPLFAQGAGKRRAVQAHIVLAREVQDQVLCLASPSGGQRYEYRAILEVSGINYHLKSDEEQQFIADQFQRFLAGLNHPIQILVRVLPLNVEPSLRRFQLPQDGRPSVTSSLALAMVQFLRGLAAQRTLLERRFYVIVPCSLTREGGKIWPGQGRGKRQRSREFEQARQQLDLRCHEIARQFINMGLSVSRLDNSALINLEYSCLRPHQSLNYPLHPQLIASLNQPVQRLRQMKHGKHSNWHHAGMLPIPAPSVPPAEATSGRKKLVEAPLFAELADLLAPASVQLQHDSITIENGYVATLAVVQLPRVVAPGWLRPLAELDEPMEISLHIQPRQTGSVLRQLRRRQLELTTSSMLAQERRRLIDPEMQVTQDDIQGLLERLASGEERLLDWSMYVLLHGETREALHERTERVRSVLYTMLLETRPASFEQDLGWRACQPHAHDALHITQLLPSAAASTSFPFISNTLFMREGFLEGITPTGEPVVLDWWAASQRNANRLIVAPSGAGKSFKTKLDILRMHLMMTCMGLRAYGLHLPTLTHQQIVIDPEREYQRIAEALAGQWVRLAPGSRHHINPFDLPRQRPGMVAHGDVLADQVQHLQALLDIMLADRGAGGPGTLSGQEKGLLDRAIYATYRRAGITADPRTHHRPAPVLRDLYEVLESGDCGPDPSQLLPRLHRFVKGGLAGLFDGPTNVALDNPLVVFDVHDLESELRPIGFFLISNYVWTASFGSTIPRQLIVDELLSLYQYSEGARFLETVFQRARKHFLGITGITQHPAILQNSTIPSNCATQILMAQEAASLDFVASIFKLSMREVQTLKSCGKGDALLLTNEKRIVVHFEASQAEHALATTDPRELLALAGPPMQDLSEQPTRPLPALSRGLVYQQPQQNGYRGWNYVSMA
jgi:hypothetical protein